MKNKSRLFFSVITILGVIFLFSCGEKSSPYNNYVIADPVDDEVVPPDDDPVIDPVSAPDDDPVVDPLPDYEIVSSYLAPVNLTYRETVVLPKYTFDFTWDDPAFESPVNILGYRVGVLKSFEFDDPTSQDYTVQYVSDVTEKEFLTSLICKSGTFATVTVSVRIIYEEADGTGSLGAAASRQAYCDQSLENIMP